MTDFLPFRMSLEGMLESPLFMGFPAGFSSVGFLLPEN